MDNNDINYNRSPRDTKVLAGLVLMVVGAAILVRQLDWFFFPHWLFSMPMLIIVIGLYIGAKHNFKKSAWFYMVIIGSFLLVNDMVPDIHFWRNFWPIIIMAIGVKFILSRNQAWDKNSFAFKAKSKPFGDPAPFTDYTNPNPTPPFDGGPGPKQQYDFGYGKGVYGDDYLDATSIFSGVKKKILSKEFKGGEIVNIFGGADVDFTSSDIKGRVIIDITQVFGGIKLIVPPHWHVTSDVVSLFAGFDDKRIHKTDYDNDKILVLRGHSFFAGVEIRSF